VLFRTKFIKFGPKRANLAILQTALHSYKKVFSSFAWFGTRWLNIESASSSSSSRHSWLPTSTERHSVDCDKQWDDDDDRKTTRQCPAVFSSGSVRLCASSGLVFEKMSVMCRLCASIYGVPFTVEMDHSLVCQLATYGEILSWWAVEKIDPILPGRANLRRSQYWASQYRHNVLQVTGTFQSYARFTYGWRRSLVVANNADAWRAWAANSAALHAKVLRKRWQWNAYILW